MTIIIVLAMHGAPSLDFPKEELREFMNLHAQMHNVPDNNKERIRIRFEEMEKKVRNWPRTKENDPFYAGSLQMAQNLRSESGHEVIIGYNEFCSPSIEDAISQACSRSPDKVIVLTPMMTSGGEHAGKDIPGAIDRARKSNPEIPIVYAWPFDEKDIAIFLTSQVHNYI